MAWVVYKWRRWTINSAREWVHALVSHGMQKSNRWSVLPALEYRHNLGVSNMQRPRATWSEYCQCCGCNPFWFSTKLAHPKIDNGKQFYLRLLWTYLFRIYSASASITTAFMWYELLTRWGSNDVISCLSRFIFHSKVGRTGAKWSIWWADNCPGQNKNNCIMCWIS